jgi:hypothetical protein
MRRGTARNETVVLLLLSLALCGCTQTYPADRVRESIQEICQKEYRVENVQVKIVGNTIGVFIPMKKIFDTDFKEALASGRIAQMENLFQPTPEALDQVEDVLFSISRVLLSTDLKLQFYILQATDMEQTGLQLVLTGYVDDIKRVRLWDISREEYRRRVLHELKLNRAVNWHRPVRSFFQHLETAPSLKTVGTHFVEPISSESFHSVFFFNPEAPGAETVRWRLGELRSTVLEVTKVLVYAPVTLEYDPNLADPQAFRVPSGTPLEDLFVVSCATDPPKILRVVPLFFLNEAGRLQKISVPPDLDIEEDLKSWEMEFPLSEIHLGDFLAEQLSRRVQAFLFGDERIRNTFDTIHLAFDYHWEPSREPYFSLDLDVKLKTPTPLAPAATAFHEDVLYLLELAFRQFVEVLRSYKFGDFRFLKLNLASDPISHVLGQEELEFFRRNKTDLQGLLSHVSPL